MIGTEYPIAHHKIFTQRQELRRIAFMAYKVRKEYKKNPELAQIIVDSYVLNARALLKILRHDDNTIQQQHAGKRR